MTISELAQEAIAMTDQINRCQIKHATIERIMAAQLGVDRVWVLNDHLALVSELMPGMTDGAIVNYGSKRMKQHSMNVDGVEIYFKEVIE